MKRFLQKYFIPHKHNDFKPHILQKAAVLGMLILIVLSFALANIQSLFITGSEWLSSAVLPAVITDLTNEERVSTSAQPLTRNSELDRAATLKAGHMAEHSYFAHNSPDGLTPWHWFRSVGYDYQLAGENLAVHFTDSQDVVDAWMDSPGHRANILNARFTEIGIGTARGTFQGAPTIFVVQMFAAPRAVVTPVLDTPATPQEVVVNTTETEPAPAAIPAETVPTPVASDVPEEVVVASPEPTELYSEVPSPDIEITTVSDTPTPVTPASLVPQSNLFERLVTQPTLWLQLFYGMLAMVIGAGLILSIVIEWRKQHPVQIAYGTGLLATLALMFYAHTILTGGVLIA